MSLVFIVFFSFLSTALNQLTKIIFDQLVFRRFDRQTLRTMCKCKLNGCIHLDVLLANRILEQQHVKSPKEHTRFVLIALYIAFEWHTKWFKRARWRVCIRNRQCACVNNRVPLLSFCCCCGLLFTSILFLKWPWNILLAEHTISISIRFNCFEHWCQ